MISHYKRLSLGERNSIENYLNQNKSARYIADTLNRDASTISYEVKNNRLISRGKYKGVPARGKLSNYSIDKICPRLQKWPFVCNGCNKRNYGCTRVIKTAYSGPEANGIATRNLKNSRAGFNIQRKDFENIIYTIKEDLKRGLSPYQISLLHDNLGISQSTIYRWASSGYGEMTALDFRRKAKFKPRKKNTTVPTAHGKERSYSAFCELDQDTRDSACEMDTVIGYKRNKQCILTLFLRSCKLQICILLPNKSCESVARALDALEEYCGEVLYKKLFGIILTDNGIEFSNYNLLEKSTHEFGPRSKIYYCDVRASNQKAMCEKNHTEIRKIIPKRSKIDFDEFDNYDIAYINSHINSQPRKSLGGHSPIQLFKKMFGAIAKEFLHLLGIHEIPKEKLNLTYEGFKKEKQLREIAIQEMCEESEENQKR